MTTEHGSLTSHPLAPIDTMGYFHYLPYHYRKYPPFPGTILSLIYHLATIGFSLSAYRKKYNATKLLTIWP
jgi:hypothetical protein